jgi:hypothetical protein
LVQAALTAFPGSVVEAVRDLTPPAGADGEDQEQGSDEA